VYNACCTWLENDFLPPDLNKLNIVFLPKGETKKYYARLEVYIALRRQDSKNDEFDLSGFNIEIIEVVLRQIVTTQESRRHRTSKSLHL
jgi:hypothetical protein